MAPSGESGPLSRLKGAEVDTCWQQSASVGHRLRGVAVSGRPGRQKHVHHGFSRADRPNNGNALTTIDDAINMVSTYQAQVGALTNVMGYQTTSNTNLTTVSTKSYGDIMNYDLAAETTALAVAQIKKNGAMAMLAQANVSQDLVTYLLKKYIS